MVWCGEVIHYPPIPPRKPLKNASQQARAAALDARTAQKASGTVHLESAEKPDPKMGTSDAHILP